MNIILTCLFCFLLSGAVFWYLNKYKRESKGAHYATLIIIGLVIRLLVMGLNGTYEADVVLFKTWSQMLAEGGLSNFYLPSGLSEEQLKEYVITDYPVGYMYVLYIIGMIQAALNLAFDSYAFTLLIKAPAIICDIIMGIFIYKIACKKTEAIYAWVFAIIYLANPAVFVDSAAWGQVDAVHTLLILVSIYYLTQEKEYLAFAIYSVAVLVKPQSLIFAPIYIFVLYRIFEENHPKKAILKILAMGVMCLGIIFVGIVPFTSGLDFSPVIEQYIRTLRSYPFATVNAYNLYALIGANWVPVETNFLFMSYSMWGFLFIVAIVVLCFFLLHRNRSKANYFFVAALVNTLTFVFSVKMHERYLFPSLVFILVAYIYTMDKRVLWLYVGFSVTLLTNMVDVLFMIANGNKAELLQRNLPPVSFANIAMAVFMIYLGFKIFPKQKEKELIDIEAPEEEFISIEAPFEETAEKMAGMEVTNEPIKTENTGRMNKKDYAIVVGLMVIYGIIAFHNLGDKVAPQSIWDARKVQEEISSEPRAVSPAVIDFGETVEIDEIMYMNGPREGQSFNVSQSQDGVNWTPAQDIEVGYVFAWNSEPVTINTRYIKITPLTDKLMINEMAFRDDGEIIPYESINADAVALMDEQELVPLRSSFSNSMYFDEIYHARTAYELIHEMNVYEWTHPQLGKDIMSLGIMMFGMTPFAWRFMGTLFGVFMIFALYALAKRIFKSTSAAFMAGFLLTFDFMHFSQTRIATIDTYTTIFTIIMFYFMYVYYTTSFYEVKLSKTLIPLGLSGIFMGIGVASKWQSAYAGAGLAVVFFYTLYMRYEQYRLAKSEPEIEENAEIIRKFPKYTTLTIGFCFIFFVFIPIIIYALAYIPYLQTPGMDGVKSIIKNQVDMYNYHSDLVSTHPYSAFWWEWPLDLRPIFYFVSDLGNGVKESISSFGNPFVWWGGLAAVGGAIYTLTKKRDNVLIFLLIALGAQYLPWLFVTRTTYIYHYFPSTPFIILLTVYFLHKWYAMGRKKLVIGYLVCVFVAFIIFYPILSGMAIDVSFVDSLLEWLPRWTLN